MNVSRLRLVQAGDRDRPASARQIPREARRIVWPMFCEGWRFGSRFCQKSRGSTRMSEELDDACRNMDPATLTAVVTLTEV